MSQNTCKVQAGSLEATMKKVKEQFGPDALIMGTREIRRRKKGGLGYETVFEVSVEGCKGENAGSYVPPADVTGDNPRMMNRERLKNLIVRMEKMNSSVQELEKRLEKVLQPNSDYPLYEIMLKGGASAEIVEIIADSYSGQYVRSGADPVESAIDHLKKHLKTADARSWSDVSGVHLFFGAGGCGKTGLVIKLAGKLVKSGKKVTVVTYIPGKGGGKGNPASIERRLGIRLITAVGIEELERMLDGVDDDTVVLIDTPCILTEGEVFAGELAGYVSGLPCSNLHYIFDLDVSRRRFDTELRIYHDLRCDFCSLSKLDITESSARFLNLLEEELLPFSFINESSSLTEGLAIATKERLVELIVRNKGREKEPERSFMLSYGSDSTDRESRGSASDPGKSSSAEGGGLTGIPAEGIVRNADEYPVYS